MYSSETYEYHLPNPLGNRPHRAICRSDQTLHSEEYQAGKTHSSNLYCVVLIFSKLLGIPRH